MTSRESTEPYSIEDLLYLMRRLRDRASGCPWDLQQTYSTIAPYTLEEVYEVIDTIERNDIEHLSEELGDLLFQVVFYARLGEEDGTFDFNQIVNGIVSKLVSRHPHVFPEGTLKSIRLSNAEVGQAQIKDTWEELKQKERNQKGRSGAMADVPLALSALIRAQKLQKRAAKQGFDWSDVQGVFKKIDEELEEVRQEIPAQNKEKLTEEIGDLLFTCVNLSRHLGVDAETALRQANRKFESRYTAMEQSAENNGDSFQSITAEQKEQLWQQAKAKP